MNQGITGRLAFRSVEDDEVFLLRVEPDDWIEGPYELTSRFKTEPATMQTQLSA